MSTATLKQEILRHYSLTKRTPVKKLIIFGTGLIAEVAHFYFDLDTDYKIAAFTTPADFIKSEEFRGLPVISFETITEHYAPRDHDMFVALGYNQTNQIRRQRYEEAKEKGYQCATYISPRATYYETPVGDNCFILENNVIQPFVKIGNNVTLWSGNHIGHHSTIGDHCFISSHVVVSGNCDIGENCFLGVNATLRDNIKLDRFVVVGAGAIVMKDCAERTLVWPAQSTRIIVERDLI
jgi:sugar O-acyltransferase (sialic acid O-acetyltransferase NeuD family)